MPSLSQHYYHTMTAIKFLPTTTSCIASSPKATVLISKSSTMSPLLSIVAPPLMIGTVFYRLSHLMSIDAKLPNAPSALSKPTSCPSLPSFPIPSPTFCGTSSSSKQNSPWTSYASPPLLWTYLPGNTSMASSTLMPPPLTQSAA